MTTASSPPLVVDIKMALEMNGNDQQNTAPPDLKYGTPSMGKMATTSKIMTPLALFHRADSGDLVFEDNNAAPPEDGEQRFGITRPSYHANQDENSAIVVREEPDRIGISPASYERPEGYLPLSPLSLMKRIDKWNFSPVSVMDHADGNRSSDLWWPPIQNGLPQTPMFEDEETMGTTPYDGVKRMVHPHTANGHFLVSSAPLTPPPMELRYSLTEGMSERMKRDLRNPRLSLTDGYRSDSSFRSNRRSSLNDSMSLTSTASSVWGCSDPFKIFVLLLQPRAKIFELIQLIYSPSDTTVGDIVDLIPSNATEPALGNQAYYGFCRPKDGAEIVDMDLMASAPGGQGCARITRGEILLAIPERYTGRQIAKMGKPLLKNPKIVELMKQTDPLAGKRRRGSAGGDSPPLALDNKPHDIPEEHHHDDSDGDGLHDLDDGASTSSSESEKSAQTTESSSGVEDEVAQPQQEADPTDKETPKEERAESPEGNQDNASPEIGLSISKSSSTLSLDDRLELLREKSLRSLDSCEQ